MPTFLEKCKTLGTNPLIAMDNCDPENCNVGCSDCNEMNPDPSNHFEVVYDAEKFAEEGVNMVVRMDTSSPPIIGYAQETVNITRPTDKPVKNFSTRLQDLLVEIRFLLEDKRRYYGNSYEIIRKKYGEIVPLIRLGDKTSRLERLILEIYEDPVNETIEDTFFDIAGYCILELLYRRNEDGV